MSVSVGAPETRAGECVGSLQEVAKLYAERAVWVRRLVHLRLTAPDPVVEDACQVAWLRLVRNRARVRRQTAAPWVAQVAAREALRLMQAGESERPLDELDEEGTPAPDLIEALAEHQARLGAIERLPARQRRLLWLQGLGFSYEEMAVATGDSRRTIERQLARARERLATA